MKQPVFIVLGLAFISLLLVSLVFWYKQLLRAPVSSVETAQFTVSPNQTAKEVVAALEQSGLVRSEFATLLHLKFSGLDQNLKPGSYTLSTNWDSPRVIAELVSGPQDIKVTLPEGWRREQISTRLKEYLNNFDPDEFLRSTATLEGQLFPDTYLFPAEADTARVISIMTANFKRKSGLTLPDQADILILASLVEREAKADADRPTIAGIFLKRLDQNWPLQVDATIQYASGRKPDWWSPNIDTKFPSPYNTYLHPGLPPGPISNPGLASINAVLHPQNTLYWYYLTGNDGTTYYARTLTEHNLNIDKYLLH